MGNHYRVLRRYLINIPAVGMALLCKVELVVIGGHNPLAGRGLLHLPSNYFLDISNRPDGRRTEVDAEQFPDK